MVNLVWLRRDLRSNDNWALYKAQVYNDDPVVVLYCVTPDVWSKHQESPRKISFWLDTVCGLKQQLAVLNIPLVIIESSQATLLSDIQRICTQLKANNLFYTIDFEPNELRRDQQVASMCNDLGVKVHTVQQQCILAPGGVLKDNGTPYSVFTPFKKKWLQVLAETEVSCAPTLKPQTKLSLPIKVPKLDLTAWQCDYRQELWPASETAAQTRLEKFVANKVKTYQKNRDIPAVRGTSAISPYLTAGILSPKQSLHALANITNQGKDTWLNELIWRDFYKHILVHYPRVGKHRAFNLTTEKIVWHDNQQHFQAWCQGQTGIPIVDAAMRQLNQIGWMHNRLRMVTAMFLTKNLFLDWRLGERYFMQNLLDGDLAANNGGWQWSASTGTDAAPYFRVFNPYRQSERFDPDGEFIRRYCPELSDLDNKAIHQPPQMVGYPEPIVDVKATRVYAIEQFKALGGK